MTHSAPDPVSSAEPGRLGRRRITAWASCNAVDTVECVRAGASEPPNLACAVGLVSSFPSDAPAVPIVADKALVDDRNPKGSAAAAAGTGLTELSWSSWVGSSRGG